MRAWPLLAATLALTAPATAADWRAGIVPTPGKVTTVERADDGARIAIGARWYRVAAADDGLQLVAAAAPARIAAPAGALPDARVAIGKGLVARAWLADPTTRYRHGVLGDAIEAASLVIAYRDGRSAVVPAGNDAVFEDIEPRIAMIGGAERIVVVKSYLARGSALAVIDAATARIVAETPPVGHANAWINPAGIADFDGDGATDIALVRQPHVLGRLEVWSWRDGGLRKTGELSGVSNHFIGSRVLGMSAVADFDGDGRPDLALPSLDRSALRLIAVAPQAAEIARVPLPSRVTSNIVAMMLRGRPALVTGLETGQLAVIDDRAPARR